MHHSFINSSSYRSNPFEYTPYRSTTQMFNYSDNSYYRSKIEGDYILQRAKLQKPGFLIKQESIYPDFIQDNRIGSALDYATKLTSSKNKNNRFYTQQNERYRVQTQGVNSYDIDYFDSRLREQKSKYLGTSSQSKINTNPNLGVRSYQMMDLIQVETQNLKKSKSNEISLKNNQGIEQYIGKSLLANFGQIKEQKNDGQDDLIYSNRSSGVKKKTQQKMILSSKKSKPVEIVLRGKRFQRIM